MGCSFILDWTQTRKQWEGCSPEKRLQCWDQMLSQEGFSEKSATEEVRAILSNELSSPGHLPHKSTYEKKLSKFKFIRGA